MANEISELEAIRRAILEIVQKHQKLAEGFRDLKASLFALQIYVATGFYPSATEEALRSIQALSQKAQDLVAQGSSPANDLETKLLKALKEQKPGTA